MKKKKIGLALGSGGAKGLAHIGAMQVLHEHGFVPHVITGSSFGAVVGGLYCAGVSPTHMEEIAKEMHMRSIVDLNLPDKMGWLSGNKSEKVLREVLSKLNLKETFSECSIPFGCMTTDLLSAKPFAITDGNLVEAIRASVSIPMVFKAVDWEDKLLVDGGVLTRVPVKLAKKMGADIVIAIDCVGPSKKISKEDLSNFGETYTRYITMSDYEISKAEINSADHVINICQPDVSASNLKSVDKAIQNGRKAMQKFLKAHPEILN